MRERTGLCHNTFDVGILIFINIFTHVISLNDWGVHLVTFSSLSVALNSDGRIINSLLVTTTHIQEDSQDSK